MFTGIVEELGVVRSVDKVDDGRRVVIEATATATEAKPRVVATATATAQ